MTSVWRFALCVLVSFTVMMSSAPLAIAGNEFGALYIGNYDDYDADVFRSTMRGIGWTQELWKTSNSSVRSMKPAHFHFTDGIDGKLTEAGDDCDLLYISGHGWRRAKFPIYWSKGASSPYDSISADTNCVGGSAAHPWEVGVDWSGKYPSNQSRWDTDIEWAIFAACSQLDYRTSSDRLAYSNSWPRNSSAKTWARTLLGEPGRMHAILGYWDTAPAGTTDVAVISEFLHQAIDHDESVGDAWARANGKYGLPWAFVTHAENRFDRLHGQGAGATADTKPGDPYQIDYYRSGVVARMLDSRGGRYEQLSDAQDGAWDRAIAAVLRTIGVSSAGADVVTKSGGEAARAVLRSGSRAPREVPGPVRIRPAQVKPSRLLTAFGASGEASATVDVRQDGDIEFHTGRAVGGAPIERPMQHAVALARDAVRKLGPEFHDAEVSEVRAITRSTLDIESEGVDEEETLGYSVSFVQKAGELYLDGPGVGLKVSVDGLGVREATGCWLQADDASAGALRRPMAADDALSRRGDPGRSIKLPEGENEIVSADIVYYIDPSRESAARPAWRYEFDQGAEMYADAVTGAALE